MGNNNCFRCECCGVAMSYGTSDIHRCVNSIGQEFDYCSECWSKYTEDTTTQDNLIVY